jgi:suppressor for copper-sensitivity B
LWITSLFPVYESAKRTFQVWLIAGTLVAVSAVFSFGWIKGLTEARFERDAIRFVSDRSVEKFVQQGGTSRVSKGNEPLIQWESFSNERLEMLLRSGKPVFIDFTADWCLTCKSNELLAIETSDFAKAIKEGNFVAIKADKTTPNPHVDSLLRKLGNSSASIPFYAVFPAMSPSKPIVMDGLYSSPDAFIKNFRSAL